MKKLVLMIILGFCGLFYSPEAMSQESLKGKVFYIVRHAEKDTGSNPAISAIGKERAGDLYRTLKNKKISLIMASQYRRTGMTADSLRIYNKIDSIQYAADATGDKLLETIEKRAGDEKNILIVGHSNTLPAIIRKLGVDSYTEKDIPDNEYDNLFIIRYKKGKAVLKQLKFGKPSPSSETKNKMTTP